MENIRDEIRDIIESSRVVRYEEFKAMTLNSYERDAITPYLDEEALIMCIGQTLKNCKPRRIPSQTDDEIVQMYAEEMVYRLLVAKGTHTALKIYRNFKDIIG